MADVFISYSSHDFSWPIGYINTCMVKTIRCGMRLLPSHRVGISPER